MVFDRNLLDDGTRLDITRLGLHGFLFSVLLLSGGFGRRRSGSIKRGSAHRDGKSSTDEDGTLVLGNERLNTVDEALS